MFGYNDVMSNETSKVLLEQLIPWRSFINSELFDNMCGISLTIGFNSRSMKAEMLEVALLNTIGLTLIDCLCNFLRSRLKEFWKGQVEREI